MKIPKKLGLYLIKSFIVPFILMSVLIIIIYIIQDFLQHINTFLNTNKPFNLVLKFYFYWIPKMFFQTFSLPILFATVYVISNLNFHNELIAIHSSGISTLQLSLPLLIFIFLLTLFLIGSQDYYVTNSYNKKLEVEKTLFNRKIIKDNYNISKKGFDNKFFFVRRYIAKNEKLETIHIIKFSKNGEIIYDIKAKYGIFDDKTQTWEFYKVNEITYQPTLTVKYYSKKIYKLKEKPIFFARTSDNVETMTIEESIEYINMLKSSGNSNFYDELYFWEKFSLPAAAFIMAIFGIAAGTYFRHNVLINSLILCLIVFAVYYWVLNTFFLFGRKGFGTPFLAAWIGDFIFTILGIISLFKTK